MTKKYKTKNRPWYGLDNAAKIFPSISSKQDTKVFRFSAYLTENINVDILNIALDKTLDMFPIYRSTLKKGLFWYYLETSDIEPIITPEQEPLCSPIYNKNIPSLLWRLTYYNNKINLEVYHALTDGTGAITFLQRVIYEYLLIKYEKNIKGAPKFNYDASVHQISDDSFQKYYNNNGKKNKKKNPDAYQETGPKYKEYRIRAITGTVSTSKLLNLAHSYHTSITILTSALYLLAIEKEMSVRDKRKPVALVIPINLRKYFPSLSARNFFATFNINYKFSSDNKKIELLIDYLNSSFKEQLTIESLEPLINSYASLEHNPILRVIPLFIKDPVLKFVAYITEHNTTASISNVGVITMPKELMPYIESFTLLISTNKHQLGICSFADNLTLSFTTPLISSDIEKNFFKSLTALGIDVSISTNYYEEE
ncbi:MAG: hypothetical protein RSA48_04100 [Bacilli bacterium]